MSTELSDKDERRARILWRDLIDFYNSVGRSDLARSCTQLAVANGLWKDPSQRPIEYDPGIEASPVLDPAAFDVCRYLETNFAAIKAEVDHVAASQGVADGYVPVHEPLVVVGAWDEVMFYEAGIRVASSAARFPVTAAVIEGLPQPVRRAGVIMLSRLSPGTHLAPHCGFSNKRLRIHLGIQTPKDAFIRVKDRTLEWKEGKCLIFDDSFEHEVWHFGEGPRIVLLADMPHPRATAEPERAATDFGRKIEEFMSQRGISRIFRGADGTLMLEPDGQHSRMMERWIAELGVDSIAMDAQGAIKHGEG